MSNSNKRKTGGAYRRKKMAISLYCKDKGKTKPKTATPGREIEIIVKTRTLHERESTYGKNKNNDSRPERIPV